MRFSGNHLKWRAQSSDSVPFNSLPSTNSTAHPLPQEYFALLVIYVEPSGLTITVIPLYSGKKGPNIFWTSFSDIPTVILGQSRLCRACCAFSNSIVAGDTRLLALPKIVAIPTATDVIAASNLAVFMRNPKNYERDAAGRHTQALRLAGWSQYQTSQRHRWSYSRMADGSIYAPEKQPSPSKAGGFHS